MPRNIGGGGGGEGGGGGRWALILVDVSANLVVDVLVEALPSP